MGMDFEMAAQGSERAVVLRGKEFIPGGRLEICGGSDLGLGSRGGLSFPDSYSKVRIMDPARTQAMPSDLPFTRLPAPLPANHLATSPSEMSFDSGIQ
jgi:hypothetical protein